MHRLLVVAASLLLCASGQMDEDFYEVLGVTEDATAKDLKKSFRKLSLKYHPDKTQGDKKKQKMFKSIRQAYDILSGEDSREVYDAGGMDAVREWEKSKGQTDFFGRQVSSFPENDDTRQEKLVPLAGLYQGGTVKHYVDRTRVCRGCEHWTHQRDEKRRAKCSGCQKCADEWRMENQRMNNGMIMRRKVRQRSTHMCKSDRFAFDLEIERGTVDGHEIIFKRKGDQNPGHLAGNVIIILRQIDHQIFTRWNDHLIVTMAVSLSEALTGFTKKIRHLDGHEVTVLSTSIVEPGSKFKILKEGMPRMNFPSEFGNLIVKVDVVFPKRLQKKQTACVGDWMPGTAEIIGNVEEPKMAANSNSANYRGHKVQFHNAADKKLSVYWDDNANGVLNGEVGPQESLQINTHVGHTFFMKWAHEGKAGQKVRVVTIADQTTMQYTVSPAANGGDEDEAGGRNYGDGDDEL